MLPIVFYGETNIFLQVYTIYSVFVSFLPDVDFLKSLAENIKLFFEAF